MAFHSILALLRRNSRPLWIWLHYFAVTTLGVLLAPSAVEAITAEHLPTPAVAWLSPQAQGAARLPSDVASDETLSVQIEGASFPQPVLIGRVDAAAMRTIYEGPV